MVRPYSYTVFILTSDSSTSVKPTAAATSSSPSQVYNLLGQLFADTPSGIFIQDGRKYLRQVGKN